MQVGVDLMTSSVLFGCLENIRIDAVRNFLNKRPFYVNEAIRLGIFLLILAALILSGFS